MRERSFLVGIFLVSLAAIVLEIGYTRIFSFKLYYYFTYLILGIALLACGEHSRREHDQEHDPESRVVLGRTRRNGRRVDKH